MYYKIIAFDIGIRAYSKVIVGTWLFEGPELKCVKNYIF